MAPSDPTCAKLAAMISAGTVAPDFDLPDHRGGRVHLAALRGSWVLLWWYPKAATPG